MATTKISERVWNESQSWWFERIEIVGRDRLRTTIRHNAYAEQSYAKIERWDGAGWQTVHRIPGSQIKITACYTQRTIDAEKHFAADAAELLRVAAAVIGPAAK
jgi:hypothetical protein